MVRVTADKVDLHDLSKAADLANYFGAQYLALRKGELAQFLEMPFYDALDAYYDKAFFGGIGMEIHSPGFFARMMTVPAMAGYVSTMLTLSILGINAQEAATAVVANSANKTVSVCDVDLEKDIRETMEMHANMNLWFDVICPRAHAASQTVGLTSEVKVRSVDAGVAPPSAEQAFEDQQLPANPNP